MSASYPPSYLQIRLPPDGSWLAQASRRVHKILGAVPPPGLLLISIVCIQVGAALAIHLFAAFGVAGTVFVRVAFAALLLMLVERPSLDQCLHKNWQLILLFGLAIAGMNLAFYEAVARLPLSVAVTLEFTGPLGVAIATSRRWLDFVWIVLAAIGILLLTPISGVDLNPLGVILALLAGGGWAVFVLLSSRVGRVFARGTGLALGMSVAAIVLMPFGVLSSGVALLNPVLLAGGLAISLMSSVIPLSLEFKALQRLPPRTYGVLVGLEPAIAALAGVLLLGQVIEWRTLMAIACVIMATIGVTFSKSRE